MADNSSQFYCPFPFLEMKNYPAMGGYVDGRICAPVPDLMGLSCCLPCPYQDLLYSDAFPQMLNAAYWIGVPALVLQVFLMLTFLVLPEKDGHGHYLNWGMVISVVILELCFVVAVASNPELCYDPVTPNDMTSSLSCAWSGALLLAGAMATIAWVLVRSLHAHLRVVWNIELPRYYPYISHAIGWGLPVIFLAVLLPITGVSFQFGSLCLPKQRGTSANWIAWYLAFSGLAVGLQLCTTIYCAMIFAASFRPEAHSTSTGTEATQLSTANSSTAKQAPVSGMYRKRRSWRSVQKVLLLQWRSIVLSVLVAFGAIYFAVVYITTADVRQQQLTSENYSTSFHWIWCLVGSKGDKHPCMNYAEQLGLNESGTVASVALVSLTGIGTFFLLVRRSMFIGWYHVLHNPRQYLRDWRRRKSSIEETFVFVTPQDGTNNDGEKGAPEAGNVTERHETTNAFDEDAHEVDPTDLPHTAPAEHIERA